MLKKNSLFLFSALTLISIASCGGSSSSSTQGPKKVTLNVWQPQAEQDILVAMETAFDALHPEWEITWKNGVSEEPNTKSSLLLDVEGGADVFAFVDNDLAEMVSAGALAKVQQFKADVTARNVGWSIDAATSGNDLYAYPETADNGFYLNYDSSVLSTDDVKTMDGIIAKAKQLNKQILFDHSGGWQGASWFFAHGEVSFDAKTKTQILEWDNAAGLSSAQGAWNAYGQKLSNNNPVIIASGDHGQLFADGAIIASVTGTWEALNISAALGENFAATKLPTFTNGKGEQQQLGSFVGAKFVGVNAYTKNQEVAHAFANFITNKDNQLIRLNARGLGPSNIEAGNDPLVSENVALAALAAQSPYGHLQATSVGDKYWTPAGAFFNLIVNQDLTSEYANLEAAIAALVAQAKAY